MSLPPNQGSEALARSGSISDLAERLNVNARTVSSWRSGAKVPNEASRGNLERVVGIPRRLWDLRVQSAAAVQAPKPSAPPLEAAFTDPDWTAEVSLVLNEENDVSASLLDHPADVADCIADVVAPLLEALGAVYSPAMLAVILDVAAQAANDAAVAAAPCPEAVTTLARVAYEQRAIVHVAHAGALLN